MLSICIPVYNFDCRILVKDLEKQALSCSHPVEIVLIDDGSEKQFSRLYEQPIGKSTRSILLSYNHGRAKVRNLFKEQARYENLLFLDCDVAIMNDRYLSVYLQVISNGYDVACGGTHYPENRPERKKRLHWKYARSREKKLGQKRKVSPYHSFMTNNFLIRKSIFKDIGFNEAFEEYGHEDSLFGYELWKKGMQITHIANQVLHPVLDDNDVFLLKTEQSISNLVILQKLIQNDPEFIKGIPLLRAWGQVRRLRFEGLANSVAAMSLYALRQKLAEGKGSLFHLNLFKLLLYSRIIRRA